VGIRNFFMFIARNQTVIWLLPCVGVRFGLLGRPGGIVVPAACHQHGPNALFCLMPNFARHFQVNLVTSLEFKLSRQRSPCFCRCKWYHFHCQRRVRRPAATRLQSFSRYSNCLHR
jgi:hypothetical protein